ncbi:glycosyltransferase family 9 protein [Candidatus Woesearchaeota archaeon]|nr:glycosyltransferase family 9 protein [Candidatus Woesearchaeota archaeon]
MVFLIKFIDKYIGNLICNFLALFNKKKTIKTIDNKEIIKKILIVQLWGIGETILTLPSIEAVRQNFEDAELNVLVTLRNKDVFFNNKNIDRVLTIKLNPIPIIIFILKNIKKYDLVIDMEEYLNISAILSFCVGKYIIGYSHGTRARLYTRKVKYNDKQHVLQTFLDLVREIGINYNTEKLPKLNYSKNDMNVVNRYLKNNKIKKDDFIVCIAPGVAESAKSRIWLNDSYAELCDEIIIKYDARIIFVGVLSEYGLIKTIQDKMESKHRTINAAGQVTLNQLFYLTSKSRLFIGSDSGSMHIAAAQGVKTIGLFGPNLPVRFGPYGKANIGLYKGYNCEFSPCINVHKGEVPDCLYPRNSNDYQKCMKNISVNDVLKEVERLVKI